MITSTINIHLTRVNTVDVSTNVQSSGVCTVSIEDVTLFFANRDEAMKVMGKVATLMSHTSKTTSCSSTIELEGKE